MLNFGNMMVSIMRKFKKYYDDFLLLYCVALYLDPRVKTSGFESMIDYLQILNDSESETVKVSCIKS